MILALIFAAALGAEPAAAPADMTTVELVNATDGHQLTITMDGRPGCEAGPRGGSCRFQARAGFHHFAVVSRAGDRMEKALYVNADNAFVWTVDGRDMPGESRWPQQASADKVVCKMQLTVSGIAQQVCARKSEWEASSAVTRQEMRLRQKGFCGNGTGC